MTLRSLFGLRSSKKEGGRDPGASASSSSPAEALAQKILAELAGLDHRAVGLHARRKHGAQLAKLLNDVHGEQETRMVLAVLAKANLAFRLLAVLDENDEDHFEPDDDRSDEGNDADMVLCKSMLSCLASYAYLGGALQIQAAGGVMQLLRFMSHDDATARAYACAAMQNATVFLELLDVKSLSSDELNELTRLCEHKDASIAEPARLVRANLEHDRRFQEGAVDVQKVAAELEELGEKERASPAPVRAKPGGRWWEEAQTLQALVLHAPATPATPELEEVEVVLRLGASGYGLVLQSAAHVKTRSIRRAATLQKAASALIKFLAQKKAAEAAAAAAPAPAPEPAVVPVDRSEVAEMKLGALREALAQRGLSTDGKKKELQERLLEALEATPAAQPPSKDGAAVLGAGAPRAGVAVGAGAVAARVIQQNGSAAAATTPAPEPSAPAVVPVDRSEVGEMKVGALREALAQRGLSTDGKKKELQERLLEALEAELASLAAAPAAAPADAPAAAPAEAPPAPKASPVLVTAVDPLSLNSLLVVRGDEVLEVDGVDVRGNLAQASMRFQEHAGLQPNVPLRLRLLRRRHGHPLLPASDEAHQPDPWKTIHATLAMLDEQVLRVVDPKQLDLQPTPMPTPQPTPSPTPKPTPPPTGGGAGAAPAQVLARVLQEVTPDLGATAAAAPAAATAATAATAGEGAVADDEPALAPACQPKNRSPAAVAARQLGEPIALNGLSLSAQAAQRLVDRAWERMLVLKLRLNLADGETVELTGRQVVGLHTAAEASAEKQIAIVHAGVRVLLTAHALGVLKQRLEAKSLAAVDPALISAPDAVLAARLSRREDGRTRTTEADPPSRAAAVEAEAAEAVECTFVFLDAARLRSAELKALPSYREIMLNHPDWHVERTLSIDDASAEPSALRSILAVSHRREMDEVPDPTGAKLAAIQRHLERHPEIELVWYDHSCLPSDHAIQDYESLVAPKLPENQRLELRRMRDAMRECACLPFLCASCLLLVDGGYCARFWTQLEAWLSLQRATSAGFVDERTRARCTIELLPNEPEFLRTLLAEVLAAKTATQACEMLRSPRVPVGHAEDKHAQLAKLERLDAWLRGTVRRRVPALVPSVVGDAHAFSAEEADEGEAGQALQIV